MRLIEEFYLRKQQIKHPAYVCEKDSTWDRKAYVETRYLSRIVVVIDNVHVMVSSLTDPMFVEYGSPGNDGLRRYTKHSLRRQLMQEIERKLFQGN